MHPVLIKIGWFELRSYGVFLFLSFFFGLLLTIRRANKEGIDRNTIIDLAITIVVSSLLGGRLTYVMLHLEEFQGRWLDTFNPFQSSGTIGIYGMTMLGGLLGAIFGSYIFTKIKKIPFLQIADIASPAIALGIFLTRIGCFLNGCCFGKECDSSWGVIFSPDSLAGYTYPNTPVHPSQLYLSLGGLISLITLLLYQKFRKTKGELFFLFLILYSILRFFVDHYRYYEQEMIITKLFSYNLTFNQGVCIVFIVIGIAGIIIFRKKYGEKKLNEGQVEL